jgi:hypothetical protein
MPRDHYVAQTYLDRFKDADGWLHGYRKPDGNYFPTKPKDVCHEWDGDIITDFAPSNPDRIADFRRIFERTWNQSIEELLKESLSNDARFSIAAHVAALMFCTPAWIRLGQEYNNLITARLMKFNYEMQRKHGAPHDPLAEKAIQDLEDGRIVLETERDYIKERNSRGLIDTALTIYHEDWTLLRNASSHPFITSDNPLAYFPQHNGTRLFPITPTRCLRIDVRRIAQSKNDKAPIEERLVRPPRGYLKFTDINAKHARAANAAVAKCAELYLLSNARSDAVEQLCKVNGNYEVAFDTMVERNEKENSELHGVRLTIRERRAVAKRPVRKPAKA